MDTHEERRQPSIHTGFTSDPRAGRRASLSSEHGKPRRLVQTWLSSSGCRPLTCVQPFTISEGEPETTTFEKKSDKPFLYAIHLTLPRSGQSYITRLSNELLQKCLEYLIEADIANDEHRVYTDCYPQFKTGTRYGSAWAISLTCRRFSELAKPLLYADVNIIRPGHWNHTEMVSQHEEKLQRRVNHLHRSIKESPNLRQLCKVLAVDLDTFAQLTRFCEDSVFFDKTRSLALSCRGSTWGDEMRSDSPGERNNSAWQYCQAAFQRLSALQELTLVGGDLRFGHLAGIIGDQKGLKTLTLWGVQCQSPNGRPSPAVLEQIKASDRAALPPPARKGTATFTELHLQNFSSGSPYALKNFLHWPGSLKVLTISRIGIGDYPLSSLIEMGILAYPWTFTLLTDALHCHKSTLRELRLGQIATQEGLDMFDLHNFPCLEIFQVCIGGGLPAAEQAAGLWVTAKLRRLVLESSHEDSQIGKCYYFAPKQVDWLDEFARLAACKKRDEVVGLMDIEVLYKTEVSDYWVVDPGEDYLKCLFLRAKELVERHGIEFVWPMNEFP